MIFTQDINIISRGQIIGTARDINVWTEQHMLDEITTRIVLFGVQIDISLLSEDEEMFLLEGETDCQFSISIQAKQMCYEYNCGPPRYIDIFSNNLENCVLPAMPDYYLRDKYVCWESINSSKKESFSPIYDTEAAYITGIKSAYTTTSSSGSDYVSLNTSSGVTTYWSNS